jgi:Centromere protein Scm3
MEPPLKRPRLSMFADEPGNTELDQARAQNDLALKSRFESIFAKYSQDFTDIGDEIDLNTGEILVDNGHLEFMQHEKDIGTHNERSISPNNLKVVASGKSMLRAMTLAPDCDDSYFERGADDVLASIENIANVIVISSDDEESDDDDSNDDDHPAIASLAEWTAASSNPIQPYQILQASDDDSLFDVKEDFRESSVDSLFDVETPPTSNGNERNSQDQEVIKRFGENIGQEVLEFLAKREQADFETHIEPAWRIPVKLITKPETSSVTRNSTDEPQDEDRDSAASVSSDEYLRDHTSFERAATSPGQGASLWKPPRRRTKSQIRRDKIQERLRAESEDPLQDGFKEASLSPFEEDPDEEVDLERCREIIDRGMCPWCRQQYANRLRAMQHLKRVIHKHNRGSSTPGHNIHHILKVRPRMMEKARQKYLGKGSRPARLSVGDFKTMVELHEAAGYDFDYIVNEKFLHTKNKDAPQLQQLYQIYYDPGDDDDDMYAQPWTKAEEANITDLCKNPRRTVASVARRARPRSKREIGTYLANKWLMECRGTIPIKKEAEWRDDEGEEDTDFAANSPDAEDAMDYNDFSDDLFVGPSFPSSSKPVFIKQEEVDDSEDELFVPNIW